MEGQPSDEQLVLELIWLLTEPGLEHQLYARRFSWWRRLELGLHRRLCPACRTAYPAYRQQKERLAGLIDGRRQAEEGTLAPQAAATLRAISARAWYPPACPPPAGGPPAHAADRNFASVLWNAYGRHCRR